MGLRLAVLFLRTDLHHLWIVMIFYMLSKEDYDFSKVLSLGKGSSSSIEISWYALSRCLGKFWRMHWLKLIFCSNKSASSWLIDRKWSPKSMYSWGYYFIITLLGLFPKLFKCLVAFLETAIKVSWVLLKNFLQCVGVALFFMFLEGDNICLWFLRRSVLIASDLLLGKGLLVLILRLDYLFLKW